MSHRHCQSGTSREWSTNGEIASPATALPIDRVRRHEKRPRAEPRGLRPRVSLLRSAHVLRLRSLQTGKTTVDEPPLVHGTTAGSANSQSGSPPSILMRGRNIGLRPGSMAPCCDVNANDIPPFAALAPTVRRSRAACRTDRRRRSLPAPQYPRSAFWSLRVPQPVRAATAM